MLSKEAVIVLRHYLQEGLSNPICASALPTLRNSFRQSSVYALL